jgi:asparagine synthase (glutamine-hydrolysing)
MLASIEVRVPLASTSLFNTIFNYNSTKLITFFKYKKPLLNILKIKLNLNFFKRSKSGFNPDLDLLINSLGRNEIIRIFNSIK